jgi:DNA-binding transcriptional LysR family regulator
MRDLNDMFFFAQVVDHGGFTSAAQALGLPKSRLSRRIQLLEERLGVRLLQRSTRKFAVTEAGQEYYRHCLAMLVEADAADEAIAITRAEPQGTVRLACPPGLVCFHVGRMVTRFMARHPRVQVLVESANRPVDLIGEGFDLAVRVRFPPLEETELVMRRLAESPQRLVASPGLLAGFVPPSSPADLAALPSLDFGPHLRAHEWTLYGPHGEPATVTHQPRLITDDLILMRYAALDGVGVVKLPTLVVGADILEGCLVEVLPNWKPAAGVVHAIFPSRRGLLPAVRGLLDHLAEEFGKLARSAASGFAADARSGGG